MKYSKIFLSAGFISLITFLIACSKEEEKNKDQNNKMVYSHGYFYPYYYNNPHFFGGRMPMVYGGRLSPPMSSGFTSSGVGSTGHSTVTRGGFGASGSSAGG